MAGGLAVIAAADAREPVVLCSGCGADTMSCGIKRGLSGRRCCDQCGHVDDRDINSEGEVSKAVDTSASVGES